MSNKCSAFLGFEKKENKTIKEVIEIFDLIRGKYE